jgi:hypothetical protein
MASNKICSIAECSKPIVARTWCGTHYQRWAKHGDPEFTKMTERGKPLALLLAATKHQDPVACLIWPYTRSSGRGMVLRDGRMQLVHRLVCEAVNGPPPTPKHEAAHNCGNGHEGCYNPHHLEWKTRVGNQKDRVVHGTSNRGGERSGAAKLNEDQVREIKRRVQAEKQCALAKEFGVHESTISGIYCGRYWAHVR